MALSGEPLTDHNLDEVIAFFRAANPFAQHTWGWDTGRFMDWRWGSNTVREAQNPGWFSRYCHVFRDRARIAAISIAEYGQDDVCIVTGSEDADTVRQVLDWLIEQRRDGGVGLSFEINDTAQWLAEVFAGAGLVEEQATGHEWEYDLGVGVATSDLKKPVDASLLRAVGDRRGRYYLASDRLQDLKRRIREERKSIPDPFEETV